MLNLAQLTAFAALALASTTTLVASAPVSAPKVDIVGTVNCTLAATGKLSLVQPYDGTGSKATKLGLSNSKTRQFVRYEDDEAAADVEFYKCESRHEQYKNTASKMYGHLQVLATQKCIQGGTAFGANSGEYDFIETDSKCSLSDDSGQSSIYWSYEPVGKDKPLIKFAGGAHNGSTPPSFQYRFDADNQVIAKPGGFDGSYFALN